MRRLALPFALYAAIAAIRMTAPFAAHAEGNAAQEGKHARAFLRHGLKTRGILLDVSGPLDRYPRWQDQFYPDHPPIPALVVAAFFAVFGEHDWVVRLPGHFFALGILALVFLLARHWFDERTALVSSAVLAVLPIFACFSSITVHQAPTLFFALAGILAYEKRRLGLAFLFQFLACYSDWPGYYLAVVLAILAWRDGRRRLAFVFPAVNLAIFGLYLAHVHLADPAALDRLWTAFRSRSSGIPLTAYALSESRELVVYFTIPALAAVAWARPRGSLLALALLALDELWLRQICFYHDYYLYPLAPFAAIAAARGALAMRRWIAVGLAVLLCAQSAVVLHRRMTSRPFASSVELGVAIREIAAPQERVLTLVESYPYVTTFTSDRFVTYHHSNGALHSDAMGPYRIVRREDLRLSDWDWVVTDAPTLPGEPVKRGQFYFWRTRR